MSSLWARSINIIMGRGGYLRLDSVTARRHHRAAHLAGWAAWLSANAALFL